MTKSKYTLQERMQWFLLAWFGFISSLQRYAIPEWGIFGPPLVFPLETLRANGRPLSMALLGLMFLVALATKRWRPKISIPQPIIYLCLVQTVIWFKTSLEGDFLVGTIIFATFGSVVFVHLRGVARWIYDERTLRLGFWAIAMVGMIFAAINLYQWRIDPVALSYQHGWFHGTMGRSSHAGVLMAATVPSIIALIVTGGKRPWQTVLWIVFLIILLFFLYKTAARTSFAMLLVSAAIVLRYNPKQSIKVVLFSALIILTLYLLLGPTAVQDSLDIGVADDATLGKLTMGDDTRVSIWQGQWRRFGENIFFGTPLRGFRIRFGESSWLGAAASLGLMGFIPMVLFGISTIQMMIKLDRLAKYSTETIGIYSSAVIAALASLLIGASAEAFLLANLNFSLYVTLQYLILGQFLLDYYPVPARQLYRLQRT